MQICMNYSKDDENIGVGPNAEIERASLGLEKGQRLRKSSRLREKTELTRY